MQLKRLDYPALIVGSIVDPAIGNISYGGRVSRGWRQPLFLPKNRMRQAGGGGKNIGDYANKGQAM